LSKPVGASESAGANERSPNDKKRERPVASFMGTSPVAGSRGMYSSNKRKPSEKNG
jgi:hypothetical protein